MKSWKLIVIPILLVILAVGAALAINVWSSGRVAPGTAPLEVRLQGVADWAKGEQGLDLLGEYTFVTTPRDRQGADQEGVHLPPVGRLGVREIRLS